MFNLQLDSTKIDTPKDLKPRLSEIAADVYVKVKQNGYQDKWETMRLASYFKSSDYNKHIIIALIQLGHIIKA